MRVHRAFREKVLPMLQGSNLIEDADAILYEDPPRVVFFFKTGSVQTQTEVLESTLLGHGPAPALAAVADGLRAHLLRVDAYLSNMQAFNDRAQRCYEARVAAFVGGL